MKKSHLHLQEEKIGYGNRLLEGSVEVEVQICGRLGLRKEKVQ